MWILLVITFGLGIMFVLASEEEEERWMGRAVDSEVLEIRFLQTVSILGILRDYYKRRNTASKNPL
jgi:hypothetical protein